MKRAAERVVIGHFLEADVPTPIRTILQERNYAAVALLLVLTQYQAGKELGIRKIFATELRPAFKTGQPQRISGIQHLPWRFAGLHPA